MNKSTILKRFMAEYLPGTQSDFDVVKSSLEIQQQIEMNGDTVSLQDVNKKLNENGYSQISADGAMLWLLKES